MGLLEILADEYGSLSKPVTTKREAGSRLIIDGRTRSDMGANGQVYGSFCSMLLDALSDGEVLLTLVNSPRSRSVDSWYAANAIAFGHNGKSISIMAGEQIMLRKLEGMIGAITFMGGRYDVPHYKYSVPRVAQSLCRLRTTLDKAWSVTH